MNENIIEEKTTYDYQIIIRQLAKEFEDNFECLGENTEKYITVFVPIKKEHDNGKTTMYKLKLIDSYRSMQNALSSLVDNLSEIDNKIIVSESVKKISQKTLIKFFLIHITYVIKILINLIYY